MSNRIIYATISIIFCFWAPGCGSYKDAEISGPIDMEFIQKLEFADPDSWVNISSTGGKPYLAEKASKLIVVKNLSVTFSGICLSSCAEYLLPSAKQIVMLDALIGFHQNPGMIQYFAQKHSDSSKPICYFENNIDYIYDLQKNQLGIEDFWLQTLSRIKEKDVRIHEKSSCLEVRFNFKNAVWFPTKNQLKELFNLEFSGTLCADKPSCYSRMIDLLLPADTSVIVGDKRYVSKGR